VHYLVTGGAGFIGSNTVEELVRREHSVCVLDDLSTGDEDNLATSRGEINFIRASVTDREALKRGCRGADYVLHLAAANEVFGART
jgi:UDP-glucose 4-epimerase